MLDKQFFQDEQFHPYLNENFLLFRAHRGQPEGDEVYKKFSVRATPTVLFAMADGREIDRILGYDGEPGEFKDTIEETYKGENTLLSLIQAYEKDSTDIAVLARIAEKYRSNYAFNKMAEFSDKILEQPEKAKQTILPIGKDEAEVSVYEFAKSASTYSGPDQVLEFAMEFPNSAYLDDVFSNFGRAFYRRDTQEKALEVFDKLITKFPDNPALVGAYLGYCSRAKSNYDRGIKLADHVYQAKQGKVDMNFASAYADLLIEKGETKKVEEIAHQLIKDNPDDEINIQFRMGYLFLNKKKYQMAFKTFEDLLKNHPDYTAALYWIGRTAATSGKNLDRGLECMKQYIQQEPDEGQPPLSAAYLRMGNIYEHKDDKESAQKAYKSALKIDPDYKAAKDALEKLKKSE